MASKMKIWRTARPPRVIGSTRYLCDMLSLLKLLPFCASINSLTRRHLHPSTARLIGNKKSKPFDAFGIIAAVCKPSNDKRTSGKGIIGVNGKLPWDSLCSDRKIFEHLTRDRIIIVGRRTLLDERQGNLDHVGHAKHCIVVSQSISSINEVPGNRLLGNAFLKLARSFDEALYLARDLASKLENKNVNVGNREAFKPTIDSIDVENDENEDGVTTIPSFPLSSCNIKCWVVGGERLYEEALHHQSAVEVHLSIVDFEVDLNSKDARYVSKFPAKHEWGQFYELLRKDRFPAEWKVRANQLQKLEPSFAYHIFRRIDSKSATMSVGQSEIESAHTGGSATGEKTPRYNGPGLNEMNQKQKEIHNYILRSRPRTGLSGPFGPWLAVPEIAEPASKLGRACRYDTSLSFRESELIILLTGAKTRSPTEFAIHTGEALKAGISSTVIDSIPRDDEFCLEAVQEKLLPLLDNNREKAIVAFAAELLQTSTVSDATYRQTKETVGNKDSVLVEITSIVGYYTYVSYTLNVFQIPSE